MILQVYNKEWESYINIENNCLPSDKSKIRVIENKTCQDLR